MSHEQAVERDPRPLISRRALAARVREIAAEISRDYTGRTPLMVGVLTGAWVFMADLVRYLTVPVRCDFIKIASYGAATRPAGKVRLHLDVRMPVAGEDVLLVEDILDTGLSARWLLDHLSGMEPASLRFCALLDKPARRIVSVHADYIGFTVPDQFVVGYGIDWDERYRELPFVGTICPARSVR